MRTLTLLCVLLAGCSKKPPPADGFEPSVDGCKADADCTLLHEDHCCEVTPCDQDALAETAARTRQRHEACARKDCVAGKHECSAKDVRFVAACVEGRCVVTRGK